MCKLLLKVINFTCAILSIIYLLHVYYDTYLDTSLFTFNPGEKENFFIDLQQNQNQFLVYDKRCQLYEQKIMNPNVKRLGDIFDFNFPGIHRRSAILIGIFIFVILFLSFTFIYAIFIACIPASAPICTIILLISVIGVFLGTIVNFFVFIFLLISYYSGDTITYYDFLSCRNVNYNGFNRYRNIEYLKGDFKKFMIFQILNIILNFVEQITSKNDSAE